MINKYKLPVVNIGKSITIHDIYRVSQRKASVTVQKKVLDRVAVSRKYLDDALASDTKIYGANTGFGALCETHISLEKSRQLQYNLLRSHAACVGPELSHETVRALLLVRVHTLSLGASGVSPKLIKQLVQFINRDIVPSVPSKGSVGASGDLSPLAHLALPLIGEGYVWVGQKKMPAKKALQAVGLKPIELQPKEGLSLINGTQLSAAMGALALYDAAELIDAADIIGALSLDAHLGSYRVCDNRIQDKKPHPGQKRSAQTIQKLLRGSRLNASHSNCGRVQDAYSFRCMPQVHGAVQQAYQYVQGSICTEVNSQSDNPLMLENEKHGFDILSGGNFHAASIGLVLDHLTSALTILGTISERRVARMINPDTSRGLPAFLANEPGLESGFMMSHVTASALASECKALSFPASVDTIPTSAGQEDHVSMAPIAAEKLNRVIENLADILAVEAMTAARALDLREERTSKVLQNVQETIRRFCPAYDGDRSMAEEIANLAKAIRMGDLRIAAGIKKGLV